MPRWTIERVLGELMEEFLDRCLIVSKRNSRNSVSSFPTDTLGELLDDSLKGSREKILARVSGVSLEEFLEKFQEAFQKHSWKNVEDILGGS